MTLCMHISTTRSGDLVSPLHSAFFFNRGVLVGGGGSLKFSFLSRMQGLVRAHYFEVYVHMDLGER